MQMNKDLYIPTKAVGTGDAWEILGDPPPSLYLPWPPHAFAILV